MRRTAKALIGTLGYALVPKQVHTLENLFHAPYYLRHTARRLEHMATIGVPVAGLSVLEVGAGVGDFSHYYLDRGCRMTITEARPESLAYLRNRYPGEDIRALDIDHPSAVAGAPFAVVHCYGVLYHLDRPAEALAFLAKHCSRYLLLETRVSYGDALELHPVAEQRGSATEAVSGQGCRPTRAWVMRELRKHFEHVYVPLSQPNHAEFPLDWTPGAPEVESSRSIFVASRQPLDLPGLVTELPARQHRHP